MINNIIQVSVSLIEFAQPWVNVGLGWTSLGCNEQRCSYCLSLFDPETSHTGAELIYLLCVLYVSPVCSSFLNTLYLSSICLLYALICMLGSFREAHLHAIVTEHTQWITPDEGCPLFLLATNDSLKTPTHLRVFVAWSGQLHPALVMAAKPLGTSSNFKPKEGDKYPGKALRNKTKCMNILSET